MTATEIRKNYHDLLTLVEMKKKQGQIDELSTHMAVAWFASEIAAQLAELNVLLERVAVRVIDKL